MLTACGNGDNNQRAECSENGNEQTAEGSENEQTTEIIISASGIDFLVELSDTVAAKEFSEMLPLTLNMSDMPHEKYFYMDKSLSTSVYSPGRIVEGDLMLWGSNCIVVFYESFSSAYSYTRIGKIKNTDGLTDALGVGSVTVEFKEKGSE